MPRKSKSHTLVFMNHGALDHETFDDVDKLRAKLAELEDPSSVVVFGSDPVPFSVSRDPVVTLGKPGDRKPRAKKGEAKARRVKPAASGDLLDVKSANGAQTQAAPAPTPAAGQ